MYAIGYTQIPSMYDYRDIYHDPIIFDYSGCGCKTIFGRLIERA